PMMGSKMLRAGDTERGFAGFVNRRFEAIRNTYARLLEGTRRHRPVVLTLWVIVMLLIVPFYLFSQKELAPAEDQGFVFGIVQSSANATLDHTNLFSDHIYKFPRCFPETDSTFQIVLPSGCCAGLVVKPVSQRKKS